MRITAGSAKGREVAAPKGVDLRPTLDKVKQALFNVLGPAIQGARVLDLFCGSGNLGLEALSRGAALACFVDRDARCLDSAREHAARFGLAERARFVRGEALQALANLAAAGEIFDIVLLDPPYQGGVGASVLQISRLVAIVAPRASSRVVLEHDSRDPAPAAAGLRPVRTYAHGNTSLTFYSPSEPLHAD